MPLDVIAAPVHSLLCRFRVGVVLWLIDTSTIDGENGNRYRVFLDTRLRVADWCGRFGEARSHGF